MLLEAAGVTKVFGKLTALDGAALSVGENGEGVCARRPANPRSVRSESPWNDPEFPKTAPARARRGGFEEEDDTKCRIRLVP